jgi:hypothetical protein
MFRKPPTSGGLSAPIDAVASALSLDRITRFELHSLDKPLDKWPAGKFISDCCHHLPPHIPKSLDIVACLWSQKSGGIQFHERLIVTDVGGVLLDPGFDEGKVGETYDIRLLSLAECQSYLDRFKLGSVTVGRQRSSDKTA